MKEDVNVDTMLQKKKKTLKRGVSRKILDGTNKLGGLVEKADLRQSSRNYSIRIIFEDTEDV